MMQQSFKFADKNNHLSRSLFYVFGLITLLSAVLTTAAFAKQNFLYPDYGSMQLDRNERGPFLAKKLNVAQAELNVVYNEALKLRPSADEVMDRAASIDQLKKSQAAWSTYTTENCEYYGGSLVEDTIDLSTFAAQCEIYETQNRTNFLKATIKNH
jgi:uncharacterized protein YecT (DUF1311 family)